MCPSGNDSRYFSKPVARTEEGSMLFLNSKILDLSGVDCPMKFISVGYVVDIMQGWHG